MKNSLTSVSLKFGSGKHLRSKGYSPESEDMNYFYLVAEYEDGEKRYLSGLSPTKSEAMVELQAAIEALKKYVTDESLIKTREEINRVEWHSTSMLSQYIKRENKNNVTIATIGIAGGVASIASIPLSIYLYKKGSHNYDNNSAFDLRQSLKEECLHMKGGRVSLSVFFNKKKSEVDHNINRKFGYVNDSSGVKIVKYEYWVAFFESIGVAFGIELTNTSLKNVKLLGYYAIDSSSLAYSLLYERGERREERIGRSYYVEFSDTLCPYDKMLEIPPGKSCRDFIQVNGTIFQNVKIMKSMAIMYNNVMYSIPVCYKYIPL